MDSPPTPLHPAANEEVNVIPEGELPSGTIANLDLNPDLYDEETDQNDVDDDDNAKKDDVIVKSDNDDYDDGQSYELQMLTSSFDKQYELLQAEFEKTTNHNKIATYQQSKLINYVDEQLLAIQRKFIKNQADTTELYSFFQLINELSKVFDLVWYSINNRSGLFGQQDYLIKLMDDMEDYVAHYRLFEDTDDFGTLELQLLDYFTFFQVLDLHISFLIDGFSMEASNTVEKLNNTQIVRLSPIASRLRILIISKLDPLRMKLSREELASDSQGKIESEKRKNHRRRLQNVIEGELGKVFEGILDRT
ncbi:uncharacterized protein AC631_01363 [Debaryomyces fabryi]|uniref:Uncharacterized protein n=1 Tax=Debaryomyces fabryi TaxID=58627 RepID=A0A0V1Q338_9ASCO|nr:uncharacterized protein AC631_01363 [Debaryomyces fabryi]KSA02883.1 hypothetical protein AC631_01363 [Debaryomyces fabryi]CUM45043.1 unnamed protein product [Debaryomyces fabryi]